MCLFVVADLRTKDWLISVFGKRHVWLFVVADLRTKDWPISVFWKRHVCLFVLADLRTKDWPISVFWKRHGCLFVLADLRTKDWLSSVFGKRHVCLFVLASVPGKHWLLVIVFFLLSVQLLMLVFPAVVSSFQLIVVLSVLSSILVFLLNVWVALVHVPLDLDVWVIALWVPFCEVFDPRNQDSTVLVEPANFRKAKKEKRLILRNAYNMGGILFCSYNSRKTYSNNKYNRFCCC